MNNNIFLELKESDATVNRGSGSWVTTLQEKIVIEENDEIILSKSMIDTNTINEQDLNILTDTTLELEYMYYTTKQDIINKSFDSTAYDTIYDAKPQLTTYAGKNFLLLEATDTSSGNVSRLETIVMSQHTFLPAGAVGDFPVRISYTDVAGVAQSTNVNLPNKKAYHKGEKFTIYVSIIYDNTKAVTITKLIDTGGKNTKVVTGIVVAEANNLYSPVFGKRTINIPSGNYSPNQICKLINRSLQEATPSGAPSLIESPILTQSRSHLDPTNYSYYNLIHHDAIVNRQIPPVPDQQRFYRQDDTANYWVGATQFELSFDDDSRRFFFNYLHTPAFDASGAESINYFQEYAVTKSGGIIFRSLTAYDTNDTKVDFWEGQLGFNLNSLEVQIFNTNLLNSTKDAIVGTMAFVYALDKVNMTAGFVSADSAVGKVKDGVIVPFSWIVPIPVATGTPTSFESSIQSTQQIMSVESFENRQYAYSHFLVSIGAGFSNNMITPLNNFRMINSIVSKFYNSAGYTYGSSSDSISYVHKGEPIILTNFSCDILSPNKISAPGVGDDNALYLNILKSPTDTD